MALDGVILCDSCSLRSSPPLAAHPLLPLLGSAWGGPGSPRARHGTHETGESPTSSCSRFSLDCFSTSTRLDSQPPASLRETAGVDDGRAAIGRGRPGPGTFFRSVLDLPNGRTIPSILRTRKNRNLCGLLGYLLGFFVGLYSIEGLESSEASTSNLCWCKCFHFNPSNHHN